jgi:hypothetical protein
MLGQFAFGDRQIEERMSLVEGQTTNVAFRSDETELAVIDTSDAADDRVTAISGRLLAARAGGGLLPKQAPGCNHETHALGVPVRGTPLAPLAPGHVHAHTRKLASGSTSCPPCWLALRH